MGLKRNEFTMPGLGRAAYLGQLYSGTTERLLNTQLFEDDALQKIQDVPTTYTSITYSDVSSESDRAKALGISGELSVSILAYNIELTGSGQYVDTSKSHVTSREVSVVCVARKSFLRLNLQRCVSITTFDNVKKMGATHVVTGIIYGGTLIASFVDKDSTTESGTKTHGDFSASVLKSLKGTFSASGKAAVDKNNTAKDVAKSHEFKLYADYSKSDRANPLTIGDVLQTVEDWPGLVGKGVPVEITLTPISQFVDGSPEAYMLHELETREILTISSVYDELYRLSGRRTKLVASLEDGLGQLAPTFLKACRERKTAVDGILGQAKKVLSRYLINFRTGGKDKVGEVQAFLDPIREEYENEINVCDEDESTFELLSSIDLLTGDRKVPLVGLQDIRTNMTKVDKGALGVVIIPPSPNYNSVLNTFDILVKTIREWRATEDEKDKQTTTFMSFIADPASHTKLLKLDGRKGVVRKALDEVMKDGLPRFMYYGLLSIGVSKELDWSLLNDEGWGFVTSQAESFHYVGQVKDGRRHGRGTITYADRSTYSGDWWQDRRHGSGELVEGEVRHVGVFIDDSYRSDGVVVNMTIYANRIPVAAHRIPLAKYDSTIAHILRIGTMLGWGHADEFRLVVECKGKESNLFEVEAKGKLIKAGQDNKLATASWPLDKVNVELKAFKFR